TRQEQKGMRGLATDGKGPYNTRATETAYDLLGRATMQRLPVFGAIVSPQGWLLGFGETPFSRQAYDRWGNVVSHSQGGAVVNSDISAPNVVTEGETTTYDYNADNQQIAQHDPTVTAFRADTTSYRANVTHKTSYDLLGRSALQQDFADDAGTSQ